MILDVGINEESISIEMPDPFRADIDGITKRIDQFALSKGVDTSGLDLKRLISGMIKGIVGCERGCPANAKGFVSNGVRNFELKYIEGGILSAQAAVGDGRLLSLKMFPDF
jgi:hypothetical protein